MKPRHLSWAIVVVFMAGVPAVASAQQLVFVVRHAERADAGGGAMATADPPLSPAGRARAATLAAMLADAGVKAIYITEFIRTQETAEPLAAKLRLRPVQVPAADPAALVAKMKSDHPRDIVLVVGHSNTLPAIIKALGGPAVTIGDNEYDNVFVIVPSTGTMTRIRF
jgi:broad specificity phosphatase PhoE